MHQWLSAQRRTLSKHCRWALAALVSHSRSCKRLTHCRQIRQLLHQGQLRLGVLRTAQPHFITKQPARVDTHHAVRLACKEQYQELHRWLSWLRATAVIESEAGPVTSMPPATTRTPPFRASEAISCVFCTPHSSRAHPIWPAFTSCACASACASADQWCSRTLVSVPVHDVAAVHGATSGRTGANATSSSNCRRGRASSWQARCCSIRCQKTGTLARCLGA